MRSLDITLLNKGVLPSIEFKEIDLDLSPVPFLENNPHIDHEREKGIITEKDRNGRLKVKKNLPRLKASFNEFNDNGTKGERINHLLHLRKLKIHFSLSLKDKMVRNHGTWSSVDDFVSALKIKVVMCMDEELFTKISKNTSLLNNKNAITTGLKESGIVQEKIIDCKSFVNKENYNIITPAGSELTGEPATTKLIDYVFDSFFVSPEVTPAFLGMMTYCYFDKRDFEQRLGIDLKTSFIKEQYFGNISKEIIIDSNGVKNSGMAFVDKDNKAVTENVYRNSSGNFTTGRRINNTVISKEGVRLLDNWQERKPETPGGKYYNDLRKAMADPKEDNLLNTLTKVSARWSQQETDPVALQYNEELDRSIKFLKSLENQEKKLNPISMPNSKLVDNRKSNFLQSRKTKAVERDPRKIMLKKLKIKQKGRNSLDLKYMKDPSYVSFTPLMSDLDQFSNVNLTFGIDYDEICKDKSSYWRFFDGKDSELITDFSNNFKILSMQITRRDLTEPKKPDMLIVNMKENFPKEKMSFVNDTPKSYKNRVLYKNPAVAQEVGVVMPGVEADKKIRFFTVKDMISSDPKLSNTPGLFEYELRLIVEDNSKKYLAKKLRRLMSANLMLMKYLNQAEQKCNFDSASNSFTDLFLNTIYDVYKQPSPNNVLNTANVNSPLTKGNTLIDAPWIVTPAIYASVLYQFNDITLLDANKESNRLYKKLEPSLSTPKKIRDCIKQFEELINQIREALGPIEENSTTNSGRGTNKPRKSNQRIEIRHKFRDRVFKDKTHNYKGFLDFPSPSAPPIISYDAYLTRVNKQVEELLPDSEAIDASEFDKEEFSDAITDLNQTKLSFLSPSLYKTPNIKVNMTKASVAKKTDKQIYSALFNEISNINLSDDKNVRQVVAPTMKKGISFQASLMKNEAMNSQNMLSKFGITLVDDPNDDIELDIIPRFAEKNKEDGLVNSDEYMKLNKNFRKVKLLKSISRIRNEEKIKEIAKFNQSQITNAVVAQIAGSGLIKPNKKTIMRGGVSNVFNKNSPDSETITQKALSLASYDVNNPDNIFENLNMSTRKIQKLPNHIKALALKNKSVAGSDEQDLDTDVLASSQTRPYYMMKHMDLVEVKTLVGFEKDKDTGRLYLNAPIYKTLEFGAFENTNGNLLCKIEPYVIPGLGISMATILDLEVCNSNFMIGSRPSIRKQEEKIKPGHTAGGEFFLEDGTEYVGLFHRREDGRFFTKRSPTKPSEFTEGSKKLFTISRNLDKVHAYMMKMNNQAKYGASSNLEKQMKASMLSSATKQQMVPKEYVRTSDINMSNRLITQTRIRRVDRLRTRIDEPADGARLKFGKFDYANLNGQPLVERKNITQSRDPISNTRLRRRLGRPTNSNSGGGSGDSGGGGGGSGGGGY